MPLWAPTTHAPPEEVEVSPNGRYVRYNELLGRGACKRVYKAFDTVAGTEVAWNQVDLMGLSQDEEAVQHLNEEIRVLQKLKHKNIMTFYAWWHDKNNQHINFITELFTAGNLRQYRKKLRLMSENVLKRWAHQILEGLLYLHGHVPPIVHRDLKCDNIFVNSATGEVKIGDLGLATVQQAGMSVVGTPEFMAPEVYDELYDEKCDIYSFGMCLLELATLEYPYSECHSVPQIFKKVTLGIPPASLQRVASPDLRDFITLCIAHDPAARPSARELLKHPYLESVRGDASAHGGLAGAREGSTTSLGGGGHPANGLGSHLIISGNASASGVEAPAAGSGWSTPTATIHGAASARDLREALHQHEALARAAQKLEMQQALAAAGTSFASSDGPPSPNAGAPAAARAHGPAPWHVQPPVQLGRVSATGLGPHSYTHSGAAAPASSPSASGGLSVALPAGSVAAPPPLARSSSACVGQPSPLGRSYSPRDDMPSPSARHPAAEAAMASTSAPAERGQPPPSAGGAGGHAQQPQRPLLPHPSDTTAVAGGPSAAHRAAPMGVACNRRSRTVGGMGAERASSLERAVMGRGASASGAVGSSSDSGSTSSGGGGARGDGEGSEADDASSSSSDSDVEVLVPIEYLKAGLLEEGFVDQSPSFSMPSAVSLVESTSSGSGGIPGTPHMSGGHGGGGGGGGVATIAEDGEGGETGGGGSGDALTVDLDPGHQWERQRRRSASLAGSASEPLPVLGEAAARRTSGGGGSGTGGGSGGAASHGDGNAAVYRRLSLDLPCPSFGFAGADGPAPYSSASGAATPSARLSYNGLPSMPAGGGAAAAPARIAAAAGGGGSGRALPPLPPSSGGPPPAPSAGAATHATHATHARLPSFRNKVLLTVSAATPAGGDAGCPAASAGDSPSAAAPERYFRSTSSRALRGALSTPTWRSSAPQASLGAWRSIQLPPADTAAAAAAPAVADGDVDARSFAPPASTGAGAPAHGSSLAGGDGAGSGASSRGRPSASGDDTLAPAASAAEPVATPEAQEGARPEPGDALAEPCSMWREPSRPLAPLMEESGDTGASGGASPRAPAPGPQPSEPQAAADDVGMMVVRELTRPIQGVIMRLKQWRALARAQTRNDMPAP